MRRVRYEAILFDLFDTLVLFDRDRLPLVQLDGRAVRTTAGHLHPLLAERYPETTLDAFYDALVWSYQEAERRRAQDHREIPAGERFRLCYGRLGLDPEAVPEEVTRRLLATHMLHLAGAAECPADHLALLDWLRGRARLGVVSNFDYAPTAHRVLERAGIRGRFEAVVVSEEVGWRKPRPEIFEVAFRRLGIGPRAALFIGDRPEIDVLGAHGVGMDVAWLNPGGEPLPEGVAPPTYELRRLDELRAVLVENPG